MDWTYPASREEPGIFEIGRRLAEHIGRIPDATRFTYDPREMLRTTREIERASRGGRLWVGFQSTAKLAVERPRYAELVTAGTRVTAFATGPRPDGLAGIDFHSVPPHLRHLQNQWFLVSDLPEPVAFVSWELGDPAAFGVGGAAGPGKRFVGFMSDDRDVVSELVRALEAVRGMPPGQGMGQGATGSADGMDAREPDRATQWLLDRVMALAAPATGAPDGAVVVPVGRGDEREAVALAMAVARSEGRTVVLVDRSGEGLLATPYGDLRGDDELRPRPDRLFGAGIARREGRAVTAAALEAAGRLGVEAGGWFPTASGADGLAEALRRFGGAVLVVPHSVRRPGLAERLRGMRLDRLEALVGRLLVADPGTAG